MFKPTLKQIEYFIALSDSLSFNRAADSVNVTQSALSNSIRDLEDGLKLKLFDRTSRVVQMTEDGRKLLPEAKEIYAAQSIFLQKASELEQHDITTLRIGVIPTIAPYLLPKVFQNKPKVDNSETLNISVSESLSHQILDKLENDEIDVGIFALPYPLRQGIHHKTVMEDSFYLACPVKDKDNFSGEITLKDIEDLKLLLLEDGHCLRDQVISSCRLSSAQTSSGFTGSTMTTVLTMVAEGYGYTLVPEMMLPYIQERSDLAVISFRAPAPKRDICLIWTHNFHKEKVNLIEKLIA